MIYLSGDTHGNLDLQKIEDFFEIEGLLRTLSKDDYLIILGDAGICWDAGVQDKWVQKRLQALPVTTLWIDGNHENFDLLQEYPVKEWNGGMVHCITPDILHLMRGYCFEIDGQTFWTFGGGYSIDKQYRINGISWWQQEMPDEEEYLRGWKSLESKNFSVDYVLTHTVSRGIVEKICDEIITGEEALQEYFQQISEKVEFKKWYFGHWHMDVKVDPKYQGLMEEIVCLGEEKIHFLSHKEA